MMEIVGMLVSLPQSLEEQLSHIVTVNVKEYVLQYQSEGEVEIRSFLKLCSISTFALRVQNPDDFIRLCI